MTKKKSTFPVILLFLLSACSYKTNDNKPSKDEVPSGKKLDIDGLYIMTNDLVQSIRKVINTGEETVRFEKGRVYYVESKLLKAGTIIIKDLKKIDKFNYSGTYLISTGDKYIECKTNLYKGADKLIETFELPKDNSISIPFNQLTYILIEKDN